VPVYWLVGAEDYGEMEAWRGLATVLRADSLIRTSTGRRLLVIEADTTNPGEALAPSSRSSDLSFDDAALAFGRIIAVARAQPGEAQVRTMRVLLGDSQRRLSTGGGTTITVRQRFDFAGEADVLIDSRAPILLRLRAWLGRIGQHMRLQSDRVAGGRGNGREKRAGSSASVSCSSPILPDATMGCAAAVLSVGATPERPGLVLDTGSPEYFASLAPLVTAAGFNVLDVTAVLSRKQARHTPRIVYHASTARTIAATAAMVQAGALDPKLACIVIDTDQGREDLTAALQAGKTDKGREDLTAALQAGKTDKGREDLAAALQAGKTEQTTTKRPGHRPDPMLEVICAARLWDDLLRSVRMWAREGHTPSAIQAQLDSRFSKVLAARHD
jgi:hypothetical protein